MCLLSMPQELFESIATYLPASSTAALGQTCKDFHEKIVRSMHTHAISPVGTDPPLHWAVHQKHLTLVQYLLRYLPVDQRDETHSRTALHVAVLDSGDHTGEVITLLLAAGAAINAVDNGGRTPLLLLCTLPTANVQQVQYLLHHGASPNAISNTQHTPLSHSMLTNNHEELAIALLQSGADPNTPLPYPDTVLGTQLISALHVAAITKSTPVLTALLCAGADVNCQNYTGITALHAGARSGSCATVAILIAAGAALDAANINGETPLLTAIRHGLSAVAVQLLRAGANGEMTNLMGITPMRGARRRGLVNVVRQLLEKGWGLGDD